MRFETDKEGGDHVIVDQDPVAEVEMGALPSIPSAVVSEPEEIEVVQEPFRDPVFLQNLMQATRVWQQQGRTANRILHRHQSVVMTPREGDDRLALCTRPLTLRDHFHSRFGDRLYHRFKPTPSRGIRLRKRSMSVDIPGVSTPSGSELAVCSGGRSVVGRGHHGPRPGRCGPRHLGCHRRWMQVLAGELEKELGQSKSSIVVQFTVDREAQAAAAASAADIVARLTLNEYANPPAAADNGMGMKMIEFEKPSMELEASVQQPEVPIFEVSKLSLSDAPAEAIRTSWYGV